MRDELDPEGRIANARVGDRLCVLPSHVDLVRDDEVLDTWPVDLRGW